MTTRASTASPAAETARVTARTKTVWVALAASMTLVGGLLVALTESPAIGAGSGRTLSPLTTTASISPLEPIFRTRAPLEADRWGWIVIDHSGSPLGGAGEIDAAHRAMGLTGLAHHFVIGNGTGMGDGEIHVGYRWLDQLPGAHVAGPKGDELNPSAIGVCLIGDGDRRGFTDEQLRRAAQLVAEIASREGIPADRIVLHGDLVDGAGPGRLFPIATFRERVRSLMR